MESRCSTTGSREVTARSEFDWDEPLGPTAGIGPILGAVHKPVALSARVVSVAGLGQIGSRPEE